MFVSSSFILLGTLPGVCIPWKLVCTMTSFHFHWKLPFSEVARSGKSRLHFITCNWEHHYMCVLLSNKVLLFLLLQKTTSGWDEFCTTPDSVWWDLACETTWKTCCLSTTKLLGWICVADYNRAWTQSQTCEWWKFSHQQPTPFLHSTSGCWSP